MFPDLCKYAVVGVVIAMVMPMPVRGDELRLVPGLALKTEFNDNIFLATSSRRRDIVSTLSPSLDITSATERRNVSLSGGIKVLSYIRNSSLDSVDYFAQSGFAYQFDPRLAISIGAGYVRDSRPDRIDLTGLTLRSGSDRQNYQLSGNYAVSEKSTSSVSYAYSQENFDNSGSVATWVHSVTFGQDYSLDRYLRQAKLIGNVGFVRNLTDISQVDNYTVSMGLTKKMHELWNVSLNVGGRYTHSKFNVNRSTLHDDDQGWIGSLAVNYTGEKMNGSLALNHDVTAAAGRNGTTERTGVVANVNQRFTRELSGVIGLGYSWNRSNQNQFAAQAIDEKNLTFNCGVRYDFSDNLFLEGNYRFNSIYYGKSALQADQNVIIFQLTMRRDLMDL